MEKSVRGAVVMEAATVATLFVIALLLDDVVALGVVSTHFLNVRDYTRLESDGKKNYCTPDLTGFYALSASAHRR